MCAPEETGERTMRIRLLVGELMMAAMDRDPAGRGFLQARHRYHHQSVLQPFRTFQAAVGQQPVVAKVDAEQAAQMGADDGDEQAAPAEINRCKGQQRHQMIGPDDDDVGPVELKRPHARGQQQPRFGGNRREVIRRGQQCCSDRRHLDGRHGEAGIPISAGAMQWSA